MRKVLVLLCVSALLLLAACGSNGAGPSGPATTETEGKVYDVALGEVFHYHRTNSMSKVTSKIAITVTDPHVVEYFIDPNQSGEEDTDFLKILVSTENVGDGNSADAVGSNNFTVYDANGKEIKKLVFSFEDAEDQFIGSELRPGGKNEGYMYLPIQAGSEPAEIIFYDSVIRGAHTNQFVIKL